MKNLFHDHFITEEKDLAYNRLDKALAVRYPNLSRTAIQQAIKEGEIYGQDETVSANQKPILGQKIFINIAQEVREKMLEEDIKLDILHEDDDLLFINKPAGMVTHPAVGNSTGTLVHALLHYLPSIRDVGNANRPGIVHRLDKGTSGVMVIAKNQKTYEALVEIFSQHLIERHYEGFILTKNTPPFQKIETLYGRHRNHRLKMTTKVREGKNAITYVKVLKHRDLLHYMEFKLETGRTHQIRVHCAEILKSPILLDPIYGNPAQDISRLDESLRDKLRDYPFQLLHARSLALKHPTTGEYLRVTTSPPAIFESIIDFI